METCCYYNDLRRESSASCGSGMERSEESASECFRRKCSERPTVCLSAKADKGSDDSDRYLLEVCAEKVWSEPKLKSTCPDRECNLKNRIGMSLEWLPSGQFLYIPYNRNGTGADTTKTLSLGECKLRYDADPRPHMAIIPLSKCEWERRLSDSFLSAGLELADLISDINLCVVLFCDEHIYSTVPVPFKIAYTCITFVTFTAEITIAAYGAYNDFTGNVGVRKLREVRPRQWLMGFVRNAFLRYLGIPATLFYLPTNVQHRTVKPTYGRNVGNICEVPYPVLVEDHVDATYDMHAGFLVKLPKVILEDMVLFAMTVIMEVCYLHKLTFAMCFSAFLSLIALFSNVYTLRNYFKATSRKLAQLELRSEEGDETAGIELERFLQHPLRRCIACCLPRNDHSQRLSRCSSSSSALENQSISSSDEALSLV